MEEIKHVKPKTSWKSVKIPQELFAKDAAIEIISLEELTDYEIVTSSGNNQALKKGEQDAENPKKKKKDRKKTQKTLQQEIVSIGSTSPDTKTKKKKKPKKKKGKKVKEKAASVNVIEDLNQSLEAELTSGKSEGEHVNTKKRKREKESSNKTKHKKMKVQKPDTEAVEDESVVPETEVVHSTEGMEAWSSLYVPDEVLWALKEQGFYEPTPIQARVLPSAIRDRMDILGAAETGSGKTLAFGIPLLHYIMTQKDADDTLPASVNPDQMSRNLPPDQEEEDIVEGSDIEEDEGGSDGDEDEEGEGPEDTTDVGADGSSSEEEVLDDVEEGGLGCVAVVNDADFSWMDSESSSTAGELSAGPGEQSVSPGQQSAGLKLTGPVKKHPAALILQPTRELAIQVKNHLTAAAKYTGIKVAVIVGGMSIQKQQRVLKQCPDIIVATPGRLWELIQDDVEYLSEVEKTRLLVVDEADRMIEKGHFEELSNLLRKMNRDPTIRDRRHTYVFSATLTLLHSGPQRMLKKKKKVKLDENAKLELLMKNIGLKAKAKVVDLTRKVGTAETLTEARINCNTEDKDIFLYYFLKQYPGRTLLFANSKDCIRRLVSIFTLLKCCPLPLHADMHQRQRLKNLDRFTGNSRGFLVASDVAARGLDIPNVQHVIHYQVPRTVENYVHRSGRTARALKQGLSVMFIGPQDMKDYRKIINTLNKGEDLPMFPVEQNYLSEVRNRVNMVRQIETQEYRFQRSKRSNDWFKKAAEEVGVDIDEDDGLLNDLGDDSEQMQHSRYIKHMKAELDLLLKQPILPWSVGGKYPTQSGRLPALTQPDSEKNAILHVKKDKRIQEKMLKKDLARPRPVKPQKKKKDKWKKKKNKMQSQQSESV